MSETTKTVVRCDVPDKNAFEAATRDRIADVLGYVRAGKLSTAEADQAIRQLTARAEQVLAGPDRVQALPLDDEELAQRALDEEAAHEHAWRAFRLERNARLTASDWTQLADAPLDDASRTAWRAYRQALRELPEKTTDPRMPEWPPPPPPAAADTIKRT